MILARTKVAFSPMPPVKTIASTRPALTDEPGDRLGDAVAEHVDGERGPLVAGDGGLVERPHVVRQPGDAEQARALVEDVGDVLGALVQAPSPCAAMIAGSIEPERVPITTPSSGVSPMVVSTLLPFLTAAQEQPLPRWAVMSAAVVRIEPEPLDRLLRDEAVARAVEAVAADLVLLVPLVRDRVEVGALRHRLVEGGVEDRRPGGASGRAPSRC